MGKKIEVQKDDSVSPYLIKRITAAFTFMD